MHFRRRKVDGNLGKSEVGSRNAAFDKLRRGKVGKKRRCEAEKMRRSEGWVEVGMGNLEVGSGNGAFDKLRRGKVGKKEGVKLRR
jgi:hypothetical protein